MHVTSAELDVEADHQPLDGPVGTPPPPLPKRVIPRGPVGGAAPLPNPPAAPPAPLPLGGPHCGGWYAPWPYPRGPAGGPPAPKPGFGLRLGLGPHPPAPLLAPLWLRDMPLLAPPLPAP